MPARGKYNLKDDNNVVSILSWDKELRVDENAMQIMGVLITKMYRFAMLAPAPTIVLQKKRPKDKPSMVGIDFTFRHEMSPVTGIEGDNISQKYTMNIYDLAYEGEFNLDKAGMSLSEKYKWIICLGACALTAIMIFFTWLNKDDVDPNAVPPPSEISAPLPDSTPVIASEGGTPVPGITPSPGDTELSPTVPATGLTPVPATPVGLPVDASGEDIIVEELNGGQTPVP